MLDGLWFEVVDLAGMLGYRDSTGITRRLEDFERHTHTKWGWRKAPVLLKKGK